jgi:hypothetical protein
MSVSTPLLETIEPDEPTVRPPRSAGNNDSAQNALQTVVLTPTHRASQQMATTHSDAESGSSLYLMKCSSVMSDIFYDQELLEYFDKCAFICL